jgi:hypothetical protein
MTCYTNLKWTSHLTVFLFTPCNMFLAGSEVLTAVSTKMAVLWVVAPCSLVVHK